MTNESQVIPDPAIEGKPQAVPIKNEAKGITFEEVKKYITQKTSPFLDKLAELIQIDPITLSKEQTEIETLERKLFALDAKVSQEENVSPKEDVERFVTRVWEHPLVDRSEEHTSELQSPDHLVCRLLLEKHNIQ